MGASNLPPGVSDSDIPGNRPSDMEWETFHDLIDEDCSNCGYEVTDAKYIWKLGNKIFGFIILNNPFTRDLEEENAQLKAKLESIRNYVEEL